jgi:hypothetical protein
LPPPAAAAAEKQRGVIYALSPSPKSVAVLWAGTDDGLVWLTTDGGAKWNDVTPPEMTPWSKVTQIDASHFDAATAYVAVSRFRVDDLAPYIYRTHNGGKTWQLITAGLDASPVNAVREDPVRSGLLFAATENAMWVSFNDGDLWQPLQLNLPHTSMRDVIVHDNDLVVATHGRSFWILDDITPLRQIDATAQPAARLFKPAAAIRVRDNLNTDTPLPPDEPAGENPPAGAIVDFYLREAAPGPVALEILDAQGKVVRRYASTDQPEVAAAGLAKLAIPPYWPELPAILPTTAGLHRWVWDLHYTAPDVLRHSYPMAAVRGKTPRGPRGPRALPGEYQVKLTVGGTTFSAPLTIRMDPRVRTAAADWRQNFDLQSQLVSLINRGAQAVLRARSLMEQIGELAKQPTAPAADLAALKKKLQTLIEVSRGPAAGTEAAPNLVGPTNEATSLFGNLDRADVAPTKAQVAAAGRLSDELKEAVEVWEKLLSGDLPALNARLKAAALPELKADSAPKQSGQVDGDDDDDDLG